jgi:phosphoribosylformylglycinamidine synthase
MTLAKVDYAATLTEMVLRYNTGATIQLENVGIALLSETPGRVVVAIDPAQTSALTNEAASQKIALTKIGTTGGDSLVINDANISLTELRTAHTETFKKLFG